MQKGLADQAAINAQQAAAAAVAKQVGLAVAATPVAPATMSLTEAVLVTACTTNVV